MLAWARLKEGSGFGGVGRTPQHVWGIFQASVNRLTAPVSLVLIRDAADVGCVQLQADLWEKKHVGAVSARPPLRSTAVLERVYYVSRLRAA
ncbi:hypothetical protein Esti_002551 [Eimeria stiedai]